MPTKPIKPRPTYGISRIDQPHKHNHLWCVRMVIKGALRQKSFADHLYETKPANGRRRALEAAQNYRDLLFLQLPPARQLAASKPRKAQPKRK